MMDISNKDSSYRRRAPHSPVEPNCDLLNVLKEHDNDDQMFKRTSEKETNGSSVSLPIKKFGNSLSTTDCKQATTSGQSSYYTNNATNELKHSSNDIEVNIPSTSKNNEIISNGINKVHESQHFTLNNSKDNVNGPSTSGPCKNCDGICNKRQVLESRRHDGDDESSSDTGNDDYSLGSQDGCIYTYRGGEMADLPSSFYSLDMGLPLDNHLPDLPGYPGRQEIPNEREARSRASSPDMDFLEMDFDPGPSGEADTGDESSPDVENEIQNIPEDVPQEEPQHPLPAPSPEVRQTSPQSWNINQILPKPSNQPQPSTSKIEQDNVKPSTSKIEPNNKDMEASCSSASHYGPYIVHVNFLGEKMLVRRTMTHSSSCPHTSNGEVVFPKVNYDEENNEAEPDHQIKQNERGDRLPQSSALYHLNMAKKFLNEQTKSDMEGNEVTVVVNECEGACIEPCPGFTETPRCLIWSEREACERQVTQIATSACGATAVVNAFNALGVPVNIERINTAVRTRQRHNNAPIPRYILSRAVAGCTAADLVSGIHRASDGLVTAKFFPTYPERVVSLPHWLADWISIGAVPILTLNMQAGCEGPDIPDSWHHQMVFGVSPRGICLCNPAECLKDSVLWTRLVAPSVLLVRSRDVLDRYTSDTDLTPLMAVPDRRFHSFNVLGQVVNIIREWQATGRVANAIRTRHIRIPASYQAGVTIATLTGSDAHKRLMHAAQLPILKK